MKNRVKKKYILIIVVLVFFSIEARPPEIYHSIIYTTTENTEIKLCVLMNTLLPVEEEKMVNEIIFKEQQINGVREHTVYTVKLYRSLFHYRNDWEYRILNCDENGVIICGNNDSVL